MALSQTDGIIYMYDINYMTLLIYYISISISIYLSIYLTNKFTLGVDS